MWQQKHQSPSNKTLKTNKGLETHEPQDHFFDGAVAARRKLEDGSGDTTGDGSNECPNINECVNGYYDCRGYPDECFTPYTEAFSPYPNCYLWDFPLDIGDCDGTVPFDWVCYPCTNYYGWI